MSDWRPVGYPVALAQTEGGIPDAHVVTVRERRVTVDYPTIVQNNVNTDTVELDLDGEWDGMSVVLLLGECPDATELAWHGEPITLPSALAERTGGIDVSVVGYSADGETRLVTVEARDVLNVVKSGCTVGEAPGDETPDLIGQLVAAGDAANRAAEAANAAAEAARGNVLTGTATGYVAHAEDAYAQKPIEVRVKGKTVKNLWVNPSGTQNGITVTSNDDGSITLSGTASAEATFSSEKLYVLRPGSTYILSIDKPVTGFVDGCGIAIHYYDIDGTLLGSSAVGRTLTKVTFEAPSNAAYAICRINFSTDATVSGTYRVMLNEGPTAQPWCPPGLNSVEPKKLVTAGKNLLNEDAPTVDGVVGPQLPPGEYTLSGKLPSGASLRLLNGGADGETITDASSLPHTFSSGHPFTPYYAGAGGYATDLMLELGSTATAYEPPNITATPLPEVELRSLPNGACDELVIAQDGTCEVERRLGEKTIDAEHPISVTSVRPASGTDLPYAAVSGLFTPFDSASATFSQTVISTSWPSGYGLKSRCVYRSWNSTIFVDERFTDKETAESIINEAGGTFVAQVPLSTEPQSPVTLPALPAPTFNQYHDSQVPSDTSVEYERDINIALEQLEAKIAALTVAQATS